MQTYRQKLNEFFSRVTPLLQNADMSRGERAMVYMALGQAQRATKNAKESQLKDVWQKIPLVLAFLQGKIDKQKLMQDPEVQAHKDVAEKGIKAVEHVAKSPKLQAFIAKAQEIYDDIQSRPTEN